MGAASEPERQDDQGPVHRVTIPAAFNEWDAFLSAGGCSHFAVDEGWGRGRQPVMNLI